MSDNRISYHYEAESREIIVTRGENDSMSLPIGQFLDRDDLKTALAASGAIDYLRRAASEVTGDEKMGSIEEAYDRIANEGVDAFKRRPRTRRGPIKAEKVAALAALEEATTVAIEQALADMPKEEQDRLLNSDRVLGKLESMKRNGEGLQLSA